MKPSKYLATAILASIANTATAESITLEPVLVSATKTETTDVEATYASEVYDANDIASSGAQDIYAFLNQNTSVTVLPSFGNQYSQKLDMRGFGIGDGYQNIAITVNGRRLNNIDMTPALLTSISLNNIKRIEITKGSGSVIYGDNATAGSIQIYTKDEINHNVGVAFGNEGQKTASFSTGYSHDYFNLAVSGDHSELDGFKDEDLSGFTNESSNANTHVALDVMPTDNLKVSIGKDHSTIDTRYTGSMTLAEYKDKPEQNSGNTYTQQRYHTDTVFFGAEADITDRLQVSYNHSDEDKVSNFVTFSSVSEYDYKSDEVLLKYNAEQFNVITGAQRFDGVRSSSTNETTKENTGYFIQGEYYFNDLTVSLGGRKESVEYDYSSSSSNLNDDHDLYAYDIGFNMRFTNELTMFSNFNKAFQAPDIDRFFKFGGGFNSFIEPAKVKTLNVGINYVTQNDKTKLTIFRAELDNEIFYNAPTGRNTNIDESHKYGVELQNRHKFNEQWLTTLNYAYTRAIIDNENEGNGSYDGKNLPGVSRHNVTVALHYTPTNSSNFVLSHNYRSKAYALNDFANNFSQKQPHYESTNLAYTFSYDKLVLSANVNNIFDKSNGLQVSNDNIYAVNFSRSFTVGAKYNF
ncbi:hypothetical protein A9Q79_09305 [Methylophaga sp. 42_25_T18]|nr:hypothetical protein A9Q79_09305 [Methylophaga sp. 42_25_T18]OUR88526.1 hypothetical protein A9Q92_02835 [Methylophaga sp. 42_8_T64]